MHRKTNYVIELQGFGEQIIVLHYYINFLTQIKPTINVQAQTCQKVKEIELGLARSISLIKLNLSLILRS